MLRSAQQEAGDPLSAPDGTIESICPGTGPCGTGALLIERVVDWTSWRVSDSAAVTPRYEAEVWRDGQAKTHGFAAGLGSACWVRQPPASVRTDETPLLKGRAALLHPTAADGLLRGAVCGSLLLVAQFRPARGRRSAGGV